MNIHLTLKSANVKTGPIPVSTSSADTCPDSCPLKAGGCYAKGGPLGMHWRKVTSGERGGDVSAFVKVIRSFDAGQIWRHNQAGDLPGKGDRINASALARIVKANKGKRGYTYTHKPPLLGRNARAIADANAGGFTVNLSADTLEEADTLKALDIGPVVTLVPEDAPPKGETPKGNRWVVCPAQQRDDVTCESCGLCAVASRSVIVAFRAHGSAKRQAEVICAK
jgi:hypothetical protein